MTTTAPLVQTIVMSRGVVSSYIKENIDSILEEWVEGKSLRKIAEERFLVYFSMLDYITGNPETRPKWLAARERRALNLVDRSLDLADVAGEAGCKMLDNSLIKTAIDTNIKVAAKLDPGNWGEKSSVDMRLDAELNGNVRLDAELKISPLDAYQQMLQGGLYEPPANNQESDDDDPGTDAT